MGGGWTEPNAVLSLEIADFRLSCACFSPRSLHSSAASLSRERSSPGGKAKMASKARSFRPGTSTERPAVRAWNPPSRSSSKEAMADSVHLDRWLSPISVRFYDASNESVHFFTQPLRTPLRADHLPSIEHTGLEVSCDRSPAEG